jgi:hypothetical protein
LIFFLSLTNHIHAQNSLNFDGVDDKVNCGNSSSLQITGYAISIEAWVYPTSFSTYVYQNNIVVKEDNSNDAGFMLRTGEGGKLNFAIGDGTGGWDELTSTTAVLALNKWQHVAGTYDGNYMRLLVNGKTTDSMAYSGSIGNAGVDLTIGNHNSYNRPFFGNIDEVRIWNIYRSQKQILNNLGSEYCTAQKGLVGYYKFNQGISGGTNTLITTLSDVSGYKNNGTLSNFSLSGSTSNWVGGYSLNPLPLQSTVTQTRCNLFNSPSKKYTWTKSGTYYDTLKSVMDCDSIIKFILTINKSTTSTLNVSACKSYTSPSKRYTWTKTGKYYDRLTNSQGCDSNITINLTFNFTITPLKIQVCNQYTSPSGKFTTFFSATINDTLSNQLGCDSILLIDVTILYPSYSNLKLSNCKPIKSPSGKRWLSQTGNYEDTISNTAGCDSIISIQFKLLSTNASIYFQACEPIKSPSGKYTYTASGIYKDTLKNKAGCDSLLILNVKIGKPTNSSIVANACKSYVVPSKKRTLYSGGTYADTILNKSGCDSIIQINLNFKTTTANINTTACKILVSPSGKYQYTQNGIYQDTIKNKAGCDSIIQINLTIWRPNTGITQNGGTLIATATGVTYQWLDCGKAKSKVQGEILQQFTCWQNGTYTVEITENGCKDTGSCVTMSSAGQFSQASTQLMAFPNPTNNNMILTGLTTALNQQIVFFNLNGQIVKQLQSHGREILNIDISGLIPGTYQVQCKDEYRTINTKITVVP